MCHGSNEKLGNTGVDCTLKKKILRIESKAQKWINVFSEVPVMVNDGLYENKVFPVKFMVFILSSKEHVHFLHSG